jgi:hypothetical protein
MEVTVLVGGIIAIIFTLVAILTRDKKPQEKN